MIEVMRFASNAKELGFIKDLNNVFREIDIVISPFSKPHFSMPIVEAFAMGKPVIATNIEGMDELIDNGVDGMLVENNDPLALANAINSLSKNLSKQKLLGFNGLKKAEKRFSPGNIKQIEGVYAEILTKVINLG